MNTTVKTLSCYCLLTLLCLALYLPGITTLPLTDRDSAHFAQASRQMVLSHDYWDIRFQNKPRHLKPPGIYWLHCASVHLFSSGESNEIWPYTLVSVIGGTIAVLLTFAFTRRRYSTTTAFLASALLAASPLLVIESHLIVTDSMLLATVVIMQGSLWQIYIQHRKPNENSKNSRSFLALLFWLGMSAGILIKGIAPLFAGLTILGLCIADRNFNWCKHLKLYWGIPLVLLLTAAWLLPLSLHSHSNFLWDMMTQDALPKLTGGQQSHGMPPGFFTALFTLLFWPGALFLWQTIYWSYHHRAQASVRFLLAWIIPAWIFLELTPTKLPEYSLPLYPAIAILFAQTITSTSFHLKGLWGWLARLQYVLWVIAGLLFISFIFIADYHFGDAFSQHHLSIKILLASVVLVIMMIMALLAIHRNRLMPAAAHALIGIIVFLGMVFQWILPELHYLWVTENVVQTLQTKLSVTEINARNPLLTVGYDEPSLVFRLGANNVIAASSSSAVDKMRHLPIKVIMIEQKELPTVNHFLHHTPIQLKAIAKVSGFNYSKGRWVTLVIYQRKK